MSGESLDKLALGTNPKVLKVLQARGNNLPQPERVVFSHIVTKINRKGKSQMRVMVITDKAIYNLLRDNYTCKRRIPIQAVGLVTRSTSSDEFVLHVPSEYDYRYKSKIKSIITELVLRLHSEYMERVGQTKRDKLRQVDRKDVDLSKYTITKNTRDRERILQERQRILEEMSKNDSDKEEEEARATKASTTTQMIEGTEKVCATDFELLKVLGRGSFGKVIQVRRKKGGKVYAMKILKKKAIVRRDQVEHTLSERSILQSLQHPFLMKLRFAFQTPEKLYFVLDFYRGGELFFHLKNQRTFPIALAKLYVGEIALALGHLHSLGWIFRDLKPENILLDDDGHVCLTDFGLSTQIIPNGKSHTFCGTPEYLAPEIVDGTTGHDKAVDWWSLGILLYELTVGIPPFYSHNQNEMYIAIKEAPVKFPESIPEPCQDIILGLLDRVPEKRLGSKNDVEDIKTHRFYNDIDWKKLYNKGYTPVFRPDVKNDTDTGNFDAEFTSERVQDTPAGPNSALAKDDDKAFEGFTYDQTKGGVLLDGKKRT